MAPAICDSRQYRFGYRIQAVSDVPEGFSVDIPNNQWFWATFIPGDTEALWRDPEYPPRVYMLTLDTLTIYSHSSSEETTFRVPLCDLVEIELQKVLLYATVEFCGKDVSRCFRYSPVHRKYLSPLLRALRLQWLRTHGIWLPAVSPLQAVQEATFRCGYALRVELDPGEVLHGFCCQRSTQPRKRAWYCRTPQATPSTLLAVTSHRLICISSGTGDTDDPYGIRVRYTSPRSVEMAEIENLPDKFTLTLILRSGPVWQFSFADEQRTSVSNLLDCLRNLAPELR
jgi:hypothetical protein